MRYRPFGKTGVEVSALGFGCMRLPMKDGHVVTDEAVANICRGIELGINYLDTGKWYCAEESEKTLGLAVKGLDRSKLYLSTKYAMEHATAADLRAKFETSLKLMDQEYIDFYHLWGISWGGFTEKLSIKGGPLEEALKLKDEGLIKHLSFSFHSKAEEMKQLVDTGYFESVLCQYNLLDRSNEDSIAYAAEKGLGVAIMGPVGGGRLGEQSEAFGTSLGESARVSTAELALRFVLANRNVTIALSGMTTMQHVEENCVTASRDSYLSEEEKALVARSMEENKKLADLYCTACNYCQPCPQEVNIPRIFELMIYEKVYGISETARKGYDDLVNGRGWPKGKVVDACVECGECEEKCPQHIKIMEQLKQADALLRAP
jgi:predicted aldo/keto reductase-like oxidoreductase